MERSFPFNADLSGGTPDRVYSADDWAMERACYIGDGVLLPGALAVGVDSGLSVKVAPGAACLRGRTYVNTDWLTLTPAPSSASLARVDMAVLRLDLGAREIKLALLTGEPASSPVAPTPADGYTILELPLASIAIGVDATSLAAADITDLRVNATYPVDYEGIAGRYTDSLTAELGFDDIASIRAFAAAAQLDGDGTDAFFNDGQYKHIPSRVELARYETPGEYTLNLAAAAYDSVDGLYDLVMLGAGGSGGVSAGGGGGAGAYVCLREVPLVRRGYAVTVGAGGGEGGFTGHGGDSRFGCFRAEGGKAGTTSAGGAGGSSGSFVGESGTTYVSATPGHGGSSYYGTGGASGRQGSGDTSANATGFGAGGGSCVSGMESPGCGSGGFVVLYGYR